MSFWRCGLARTAVCGEAVVHDAWCICYLVSGAVGDHVNVRISVPCGRGGMACVGRLRGGVGVERAGVKSYTVVQRPACGDRCCFADADLKCEKI